MLVYANHFRFEGEGVEEALFKAIGGWLKEQLGFGLHPDQLRREGEFEGCRSFTRFDGSRIAAPSRLRIVATDEEEPVLYAWTLRNPDDSVRGRHWITELGFKRVRQCVNFSCVLRTDESSVLAGQSPVAPSCPRVIRYVVKNVEQTPTASFAPSVGALEVKSVGEDMDSYHALAVEIGRQERDCPLLLVSPTKEGEYLLDVEDLQQVLIGLGQVVQIHRNFNSYDMAEVLGQQFSAWGGAVNVLFTPTPTGIVRNKLFLSDEILDWGSNQHERISHLLKWVTNNTNVQRLRERIRPEGVAQLAIRRRMHAAREKSLRMTAEQLRLELEKAENEAAKQIEYFDELVNQNSQLEATVATLREELEDAKKESARKDYTIQSLKDRLSQARESPSDGIDVTELVELAWRDEPSPLDCLDLLEKVYPDKCIVLPSARSSAEEMNGFANGRELMRLLRKLVTDYRSKLMNEGDSRARTVFSNNEYAAKESETVMRNKAMRRLRTFLYDGREVEMFRHLKIGVANDVTKTIRVHFHWDADKEKIVIGYCGKHLPVSSC